MLWHATWHVLFISFVYIDLCGLLALQNGMVEGKCSILFLKHKAEQDCHASGKPPSRAKNQQYP